MRRGVAALIVAVAALFLPASAFATITTVFGGQTESGNAIACTTQTDGVRVCHGSSGGMGSANDLRLKSFDGSPLEVYVILPPVTTSGPYPLIVQGHGWGGSAGGPNDTEFYGPTADAWAKQGYAVLQITARGFNDSCGSMGSRSVSAAACLNGYIRLDDERYEARDVQNAAGLLVDSGFVDPNRIGVTGESYGGGLSLELATLKDRIMNSDGSLSQWKSPGGTPLHIAAAAPVIPWSDLVYSLLPNGHTIDNQVAGPTTDLAPCGVPKQSFVAGLFAAGAATGYYSATDSQANLPQWYASVNAGEPCDGNPTDQTILTQIAQFHSPYYLLDGKFGTAKEAPSPLLIANGYDDDLFPIDENLRYYNLDRSLYPSNPIELVDGDFGHMRSQNKAADKALLSGKIQSFLAYYLNGTGSAPPLDVTSTIETCPSSTPSGGPFSAPTWDALHPGQVSLDSSATQTISSSAGDPSIAAKIDPIAGNGACATAPGADQGSGVASYHLPTSTGSGYTLLGSTTITATLNVTGTFPLIAERLWDVDPSGTETLVARGVYRLDPNQPNGVQTFQLHPGAWHFAAGHYPKLELLGQDAPYVRRSNGTFTIAVQGIRVVLPVHEAPGSSGVPSAVQPFGTCVAHPFARISKKHGSRHRLSISGSAGETPCANASSAQFSQEHVKRVFLIVYRKAAHGRCRFLTSKGRLTRARSCRRPVRLRARGTRHWKLKLKMAIPAGHYLIRVDAVDGMHHHQLSGSSAVVRVNIR